MVAVASEAGYAQVTVEQVVRRARVSRKTFYELFDDRQDCFLAAFEDAVATAAARVSPAFQVESKWSDRVREGLRASLEFLDQEPELAQLCVVQALNAGPQVLERRSRVLQVMAQTLDRGRLERSARLECSALTAEGLVGAVFAVVHARLSEQGMGAQVRRGGPLVGLLGELMGMIVLPYLGPAAARAELARRSTKSSSRPPRRSVNPLDGLNTRLTYRTMRTLEAIAADPGMNNREIGQAAGVVDQGQVSKLLGRLEGLGLVRNISRGEHAKGAPNSWALTTKGGEVQQAITEQSRRRVGAPSA